jgi:hypothetical protein
MKILRAMKNKSKQIKPPVADKSPEKLARLKALNARIRGKFKNFMTQEDLRKIREDEKWETIHQTQGQ